jgi:hypothetical protein
VLCAVACSVRLAPRATHTTCLDVADIEGAHPGSSRDRAQLFPVRKAAAASACAQQEAAQAVLAGLQLSQRQLLQLWSECSRLDRDRSGFLSGTQLGCCCCQSKCCRMVCSSGHQAALVASTTRVAS